MFLAQLLRGSFCAQHRREEILHNIFPDEVNRDGLFDLTEAILTQNQLVFGTLKNKGFVEAIYTDL